jgi:succinate dehydrogenase/fumarate reductase flavoprotein subunit
MAETTRRADVVVVGAGMAGLVAAVEAQEHASDVVVLEKGPRAGGSMYLSAGIVYTYDSYERVREAVPHGDPRLQKLVVDRKDEDIRWLEDLGVDLREPEGDIVFGSGKQLDPEAFTGRMVDTIESGGGEVRFETPMVSLHEEDGRVVGVEAEAGRGVGVETDAGSGGTLSIEADGAVLATGGFQGDETLVEQFVTDRPERMWLRANPWSTGDALRAATDAGAKTTGGMGSFYGHNLPAPPAEIPPSKLLDAKQAYGVKAIALDERGQRYADESASPYEVVLTQETAKRTNGRAYYVVDDDLYGSQFASREVSDSIATAADLGGRVATAESLADLESALFEWGVDGARAVGTVRAFNAAVREGEGRRLDPPRRNHQTPIDEAPFRVVEVQPGITFTMGGIDVTEAMAVRRHAATESTLPHWSAGGSGTMERPVPGLFAAGMDVGNVMRRQYMGGLAVALVTGRIAGRNAATSSR